MSLMVAFLRCPFSPRDVLDEIWDLTESVSEGFLPTINDVITYPMMLVWNMTIQHMTCSVTNPCASFNFPIR